MSSTDEVQTALAAIRKGMAAGRLAHAYLVVGNPRGNAGQFADELLAMLYCSAPGERPCRECSGCRRIAQRSHPDLVWVEPQKKSRTIQKEQVEEIQRHIFQTSLEGGWKSVVLVHAERLNEVAANKLLKTLEEPPAKCIFLLLSAKPEFLPPTIMSRCQRVILSGEASHEESALKAEVMEIVAGSGAPGAIGGIVRARKLLDLFKTLKDEAKAEEEAEAESEILDKMGKTESRKSPGRGDADSAIRKEMENSVGARIEGQYRENRALAIRWLLFWCRDVLFCVCGLGQDAWYFRDAAQKVQDAAAGLSYRQALDNIRIVEELKDQLEQSLPEAMVLERAMVGICRG